jgi:uncharacterized protein YjiS (DUF1127 family)
MSEFLSIPARTPHRGAWRSLLQVLGCFDAALAARRQFLDLPDQALADIGMSREEATGAPGWHAELPFFLQPGYGRNSCS